MYLSNQVVERIISENIGQEYLSLVKVLKKKREIAELRLAGSINKNINITRSMLYRLASSNLVVSRKVKDKKTGWFVYYWSLNCNGLKYLAKKTEENKINAKPNIEYLACPNLCCKMPYEQSMHLNFKCPECGSIMYKEDNTSIEIFIKEVKKINDSAVKT